LMLEHSNLPADGGFGSSDFCSGRRNTAGICDLIEKHQCVEIGIPRHVPSPVVVAPAIELMTGSVPVALPALVHGDHYTSGLDVASLAYAWLTSLVTRYGSMPSIPPSLP